MDLKILSLLLIVWISNVSGASYLISAPASVIRGSNYGIAVDILNTTDVVVTAELQEYLYHSSSRQYEMHTLKSAQNTFDKGKTGLLTIPIEDSFSCQSCYIHVRGSRGLQFERRQRVSINSQLVAVLIQTDKAIYKPGQRVRFRALAVYPDLKVYNGKFHVEIKDPRGNKIKILSGVSTKSGVVEGNLDLSEQPPFGDWSISVSLEATSDSSSQSFTVADYDLPRFEITVELPPYGLVGDNALSGTVKAKYTFGQPVKGQVELHVGPDTGADYCGRQPSTLQSSFEIDGEAKFSIPLRDLSRFVNVYGSTVRVMAIVKEATTGIRLNGTETISYYRYKYDIKFLENTPNVFKPGLPYTAYVQVESPDKRPPSPTELSQVSIHAYASYRVTAKDQSLYGTSYFTGSYPLPGYDAPLPSNGVLPIKLDIPHNATSITINVHYNGRSARKTVSQSNSKSNNYVQLSLESKNLKAGETAHCKLVATEPLNLISMLVMSRGGFESSFTLDGQGNTSVNFDLNITPQMAPTGHLLAYYKRNSTEIVADSIAFKIDGIFNNKVSVAYNVDKSEPNHQVDLIVRADPNSTVNILAVDQSVLLLKSGNDITANEVNGAISSYDKSQEPSDSEFAVTYSAKNTDDIFRQMDLVVMTDVVLRNPDPHGGGYYPDGNQFNPMPTASPAAGQFGSPFPYPASTYAPGMTQGAQSPPQAGKGPLKKVEHIRKIFPEAWLWESHNVSTSGVTTIKATVPDTITSWVTSAFATNDLSGLGVAPATAKLTVFRPFFVALTYPSTITRNEQAVIQVTVYNYLQTETTVVVTLKQSSNYQSIDVAPNGTETTLTGNQQQTIKVLSGKQGVMFFPIVATNIGVADIEVTAQSTVAADGVRRQIVIQAEGAPVTFNYPILVNLDNSTNTYADKLSFPAPPSLVPDSERMKVKVSGDLLGPSLNNIESLLALPTGCGEQSMVKFAPDLYIAQYLKSTGQLTDYWNQRITMLLNAGYQRELTYQRYDGSFSAFGNWDEAGSTWLTAFVSRTFSEAREFIYVDPNLLTKTVNWMISRQNKDGSFSEFGRVLDQSTQGSHTGPALTAYVLLALLQNQDVYPLQGCQPFCANAYRLGNATANAVKNLESVLDSITDDFTLSVVTYSLVQAHSGLSDKAFNKLVSNAIDAGGLQYWISKTIFPTVSPRITSYNSRYTNWQPPQPQARPIDILTTSYGILSFTSRAQLGEGLPALRWLLKQRSARGGFASTQDTTVALQAVASYARSSHRPTTNMKVKAAGDSNETLSFDITDANVLSLQMKEYTSTPANLDLDVRGNGLVVVEIDHSFSVRDELSTPSFDVSTVLLDDDLDSFNLMICTKWLWDRDTGMVVQEIGIPSGFNPDLTTLGNVVGLKRSERIGDTVAIYFDQIGKTSTCYSLLMTRNSKVAKSEKSFIRTFDYYEPADQSTVFYQPRKLRDSTICDVCRECCA